MVMSGFRRRLFGAGLALAVQELAEAALAASALADRAERAGLSDLAAPAREMAEAQERAKDRREGDLLWPRTPRRRGCGR